MIISIVFLSQNFYMFFVCFFLHLSNIYPYLLYDQAYFEELVQFMSSGPSHILVLSQAEGSANVVPAWREFIGPADTEEARREKPDRSVSGTYS